MGRISMVIPVAKPAVSAGTQRIPYVVVMGALVVGVGWSWRPYTEPHTLGDVSAVGRYLKETVALSAL